MVLPLENQAIFELMPHLWVAQAQLDQTLFFALTQTKQHQTQRQAIRHLLQNWLNNVPLSAKTVQKNDTLDETAFPYRLKNSQLFVSFSHSQNHLACAISPYPIGVDIEYKPIHWRVAQRYFHPDEIHFLAQQDAQTCTKLCQILWQIKECLTKIYQIPLLKSLRYSLAPNLPKIMQILRQIQINSHNPNSFFVFDLSLNYLEKNPFALSTKPMQIWLGNHIAIAIEKLE